MADCTSSVGASTLEVSDEVKRQVLSDAVWCLLEIRTRRIWSLPKVTTSSVYLSPNTSAKVQLTQSRVPPCALVSRLLPHS